MVNSALDKQQDTLIELDFRRTRCISEDFKSKIKTTIHKEFPIC